MPLAEVELEGIPLAALDEVWPAASVELERAIKYANGQFLIHDIYDDLADLKKQLWRVNRGEAWIVTEIGKYRRKQVCTIVLAAGRNYDAWAGVLPMLEAWAKSIGCRAVEINGRPGWQRKIQGYRNYSITLSKDL